MANYEVVVAYFKELRTAITCYSAMQERESTPDDSIWQQTG
jgi:hypothetical protein